MVTQSPQAPSPGFAGNTSSRIVVAGGGPVGFTVALALARQGLAVTVIEADTGVCDGSRAICISRRSLQLLDRLGVAAAVTGIGLGWTEARSYLGTEEVFHLRMAVSPDDRFPPFVNIQQYHVERILADACAATGLVDIRWGHRLVGLDTAPDRVGLSVEHDGDVAAIEADWLVAADGGRSFVREQGLGLALEGRSFESRYLIADIETDIDWPTERKVWFDPVSNPRSTVIMHRQPGNVWRIDYQLQPGEADADALTDESIRARISSHMAMLGLPNPWRLLWKTLYRAHTLSLADYVHGRVLFAGDAAHLVPIFGVRGLNSGLDDGVNLAWKLALVAGGRAPETLLASYTEERRTACLENIESATKSTWFMSPPSDGFVTARDAVLELSVGHPRFRVLIDPRQASAHRYRSSAIDESDDAPGVGLPLPEARTGIGDLLDLAGGGFAAVVIAPQGAPAASAIDDTASVPFIAITLPADDPGAGALAGRPGDLLVVRPDGYVCARRHGLSPQALGSTVDALLAGIGLSLENPHDVAA